MLAALGAEYREELYDRRSLLTPPHYAYLKIAEGCNRACSFCSIPKIRGRYRSQPIDQLLREAALLQKRRGKGAERDCTGHQHVRLRYDGQIDAE